MQVVHFDPKIWEILLLLVVGFTLAGLVAKRPNLFWPLLIIVNILGIGPSLMKYFFWDKALTGFIVFGAMLRISAVNKGRHRDAIKRDDHKLIFGMWIGYMIMESVIGVIVNSDPRIIFWSIFYALLGMLAYILCYKGRDFPFPAIRQFSLIVLVTVLLYNIAYLTYGIIIEKVLGVQYGRFAAQFLFRDTAFTWSGPSIALYPTIIGMPAAIFAMNDDSFRVRMLVLFSVVFMISTAFYYDSRAAYIIILCVFLVSLRKIRFSKIIITILIFFALLYCFKGIKDVGDFFSKDIFSSTQMVWSPSKHDLPRQLHTVAAFMRITDNAVTFFVGDGMYAHKITLGPYLRELNKSVNEKITIQSQHLRDDEYFRTTAFSALLIDTGIIGMLTLIFLFICTACKVISRKGPYRAVLLATLFLTFMWMFVINVTVIMLFYLLFMPCGIVDQLSKTSVPIKNG